MASLFDTIVNAARTQSEGMDVSKEYQAMKTAPVKAQAVQEATQQKMIQANDGRQLPMLTANQFLQSAAGQATNQGLPSAGELETDIRTMNMQQLSAKYGYDQALSLVQKQVEGNRQYAALTQGDRSYGQAAKDALVGVGQGAANMVGGLTAAFLGNVIHPDAGTETALGVNKMNDAINSLKSQDLQDRTQAQQARTAEGIRDNTVLYEKDLKEGNATVAKLARVGRDTMTSLTNANDLATFSDGTAQGIGSLVLAGPMTKAVGAIGAAGEKALANRIIAGTVDKAAGNTSINSMLAAAATKATPVLEKAAMPVAVGLMEGGGAYQQSAAQVMGMSFDDLAKNSDSYNAYLSQGLSPDQARSRVAHETGNSAATKQALAAAATGAVLDKFSHGAQTEFVKNPFSAGSVAGAAGNLARETVEEGIQSGTGQTAQNLAIQQNADRTQDLSEGVGEQVGQGALYGLGSAGVAQAPAGTIHAAKAALAGSGRVFMAGAKGVADVVGTALKPVGDALYAKGEEIRKANEAASPVSDEAVVQASQEAVQTAPEATQAMKYAVQESNATPEEKDRTNAYIDQLGNTLSVGSDELAGYPELDGSTSRADAVQRISKLIKGTDQNSSQQMDYASKLVSLLEPYNNMSAADPEAMSKVSKDSQALNMYGELQSVITAARFNPRVESALREAQSRAAQVAEEGSLNQNSNLDPATTDGAKNLRDALLISQLAPEKANLELNKKVLFQAEQGNIQLTPSQMNGLKNSIALLQAQEAAIQELESQGNLKAADQVTKEIAVEKNSTHEYDLSGKQYTSQIMQFMAAGNTQMAQPYADELAKFAQHMNNKVQAINEAFADPQGLPSGQTYQKLNPVTRVFAESPDRLKVLPSKEGSVQFAQRVAAEAKLVTDLYNNILQAYPELKSQNVSATPLVTQLVGNAKDIAASYTKAQSSEPVQAKEATTTTDASTTEKVVEPKSQGEPSEPTSSTKVEESQKPLDSTSEAKPESSPATPEIQTTQENESKEPVKTGVRAAFPDLIEQSRLDNAFRLPSEATSRLTGSVDPSSLVRKAMQTSKGFAELAGKDTGHSYQGDVVVDYSRYLRNVSKFSDILDQRLSDFVNKKGSKGTLSDWMDIGGEANRMLAGRVLNIAEKTENGYQYNPELRDGAVLAGMQWAINAKQFGSVVDSAAIEAITELPADQVDPATVAELEKGMSPQEAITSLGNKIQQYWGLRENKSAPIGETRGIPYSMAAEMLMALVKEDVLTVSDVYFNGQGQLISKGDPLDGGKHVQRLIPTDQLDKLTGLKEFPDAIDHAVLVDPEPITYVGGKLPPVAKTQLHNDLVENTTEQRKAIDNEQKTPFYLNMPMVNLFNMVGRDGLITLFGGGHGKAEDFNVNHWASIEGKNRSVTDAFNYMQGLVSEVGNVAKTNGTEIHETEIHYAYNMSSLGRMQMQGKYNPQSNKLMREAVMPTRSTLDLTKAEDLEKFNLALAQALDVKVHNVSRATGIAEAMTKLTGPLAESVDLLRAHLKQPDVQMSPDKIETIRAAMKASSGTTVMALHAMTEFARFLNSTQSERQRFTTHTYLEADGVTNGPINAMKLLSVGSFTPTWIQNMSRGGLTVGEGNTSLATIRARDSKDMYEVTADALQKNLSALRSNLDDAAGTQMDHLMNLFKTFDPNVKTNDEGDLVFKRGITKNPLTITLYGSGARGIAGKQVATLTGQIYEKFSDTLQTMRATGLDARSAMFGDTDAGRAQYDSFIGSLEAMLTNRAVTRNGKIELDKVGTGKLPVLTEKLLQTFQLDKSMLKNLTDNMLALFTGPMRDAITENVGESLLDSATNVRKATQVQSIFLQHAYVAEVQKVMAEKAKDPSWKETDFLSQKELDGIYAHLKNLMPMVHMDGQTFYVAGSTNTAVRKTEVARTVTGDFRTPAFINAPADAGVAGVPMLNIGAGDAAAMLDLSNMKNAPEGSLKIFDGVNFKLTSLFEDSLQANQAIQSSWNGNPLRAVSDTFSKFLKDSDTTMTKAMEAQLEWALFGTKDKGIDQESLSAALKSLDATLDFGAKMSEARTKVLNEFTHSIDQMAAAGTPLTNQGNDSLSGKTPEEKAALLNERYQAELDRLTDNEKSEDIFSALAQVGKVDKASGARVLSKTALINLRSLVNLPAEQSALLGEIVRSKVAEGYKIVHGTQEQINAYTTNQGNTLVDPQGKQVSGYTVPGEKTIYLINPSSETLVHELIHASTYDTIAAHYEGNSNPMVKGAVERLEILRNQFMSLSDQLAKVSPELQQAYTDARSSIEGQLSNGDKAGALNEFMAWGLSNQELMRLQQRNQANPLVVLAKNVYQAIKQFIWGRKQAPTEGTDMFSNLMFNSRIIVRNQPTLAAKGLDTVLFQSHAYGNDERIANVDKAFFDNITNKVSSLDPMEKATANTKIKDAILNASGVSLVAQASGFGMTAQEASTFRMIVGALATEHSIDPNALAKASELHQVVIKNLKVEDFMGDRTDDASRYYAQKQYDFVVGNLGIKKDAQGRSSLMPSFLGLAIVNEQFRDILSTMELKGTKFDKSSLDQAVASMGNMAMESLSNRMSGTNQSKTVREAIDGLAAHLADSVQSRESFLDSVATPTGNVIDRVNDQMVNLMAQASNAALKGAEKLENGNILQKSLASALRVTSLVTNEENGARIAEGFMKQANEADMWTPLHELLNDLVGRTSSNAEAYDLNKVIRMNVQQTRQQFREGVPKVIASKFSRPLTDAEWTAAHYGLAKTDIAALDVKDAHKAITDDAFRASEINRLEKDLQSQDPTHWSKYSQKINQLASFMNTGTVSTNLLRNAYAISQLYGETKSRTFSLKDEAFVQKVDQLISLKALDTMYDGDRTTLSSLVQSEAEGMTFVHQYLTGQRAEELRKAEMSPIAQVNQYKGYVPTQQGQGMSLIVADDSQHADLVERSYVPVGAYDGSSAEQFSRGKTYFFAPVSSKASFQQGMFQNARQTAGGVDVRTGYSTAMNAGVIADPASVQRITRALRNETGTEKLLPVYDETGKAVAYERSVDPLQLDRLENNTNLSEMLGVWRGRQVEEQQAQFFNERVVKSLHDMYTKDGSDSQYVDLYASQDPVIQDAMKLLTPDTRDAIKAAFGDTFMVRKDMLNDALGYRSASIGDAWTGNSRWSDETQDRVKTMMLGFFGNAGYQKVVNAEKILQNVVSNARTMIAVKSVIVPFSNMMANIYQLTGRGVPLLNTLRSMPKKTAEIEAYTKNRARAIEVEAEMRAAEGDVVQTRKLNAELKSLEDANTRLSIWPLIQAGEFSTISDAHVSQDDTLLSQGKISDYIDSLVNKLPPSVQALGKYAVITKDTALFHGLHKAVSYGDFLAKAVLFDDLTIRQKKSKEYALGRVTEEFVNYERLSGRFRQGLEANGLLWFYNFKIRSSKIAMSMVRNNPVHTLLASLAPTPSIFGSVGLPTDDNLITKGLSGELGWSIGPRMMFHAPAMNPWVNLVN